MLALRRVTVALVATAVLSVVTTSTAHAAGLAVTPQMPASGGSYPVAVGAYGTATRIEYEADAPAKLGGTLFFEVATQNIPGQDGTLASEFVVDSGYLTPGDAFPTHYKGNWYATFLTKPGTYYIQFYAYLGCPQGVASPCTSDVFSFTVVTPASQPPTPAPETPSTSPQTVPGAAPVSDVTPPHVSVFGATAQRVRQRGLRFAVECDEPCSVGVAAIIKISGRFYRFKTAGAIVGAGQRRPFKLTLNASGRRALSRALRSGKRLYAFLSVYALDASKNSDGGSTYRFHVLR